MNKKIKKELEKIARRLEEQAAVDLSLANALNELIIQLCQ